MANRVFLNVFRKGKEIVRLLGNYARKPAAEAIHTNTFYVGPFRLTQFRTNVSALTSQLRRRAAFNFGRANGRTVPCLGFAGFAINAAYQDGNYSTLSPEITDLLQEGIKTSPIIRQLFLHTVNSERLFEARNKLDNNRHVSGTICEDKVANSDTYKEKCSETNGKDDTWSIKYDDLDYTDVVDNPSQSPVVLTTNDCGEESKEKRLTYSYIEENRQHVYEEEGEVKLIQTSPIEKYNQWEVTDSSIKFNKDEGCTDVKTSCEDEEDSGDGYMENDPETSSDEEGLGSETSFDVKEDCGDAYKEDGLCSETEDKEDKWSVKYNDLDYSGILQGGCL